MSIIMSLNSSIYHQHTLRTNLLQTPYTHNIMLSYIFREISCYFQLLFFNLMEGTKSFNFNKTLCTSTAVFIMNSKTFKPVKNQIQMGTNPFSKYFLYKLFNMGRDNFPSGNTLLN